MSALATSITVTYMPHAKILLAGLIARAAKATGETESNATVSPNFDESSNFFTTVQSLHDNYSDIFYLLDSRSFEESEFFFSL